MIEYKKATFDKIEDILELENSFFKSKSESPSETREGIELFLRLGGECIIQYLNNKPSSYVGIIKVKNLDERINSLSNNSPLKKVYQRRILENYRDYYFVHSWVSLNQEASGLFHKIFGKNSKYYDKKLVGFCLKSDKKALNAYLRFGKVVEEIADLYSSRTVHCVLISKNRE